MAILTDERMKELSDILGEVYKKEKDAIGDETTPGTMTYEINKLNDYVDGNIAKYGLLSGCDISLLNINTMTIGYGVVVYDNTQYDFESSNVSVLKTFKYNFGPNYHYGFIVAFSIDDLESSSISFRSKLTNSLTANISTYIEIDNTDLLSYTPPFLLTIDGEEIEVWSIDSNNHALIAPHYNNGTVVNNHTSGAVVFINKPLKPQIFFGLPVDTAYQSGGNPDTFSYYPPVSEEDYILLYRGIATLPNTITTSRTPQIVGGLSGIEDLREFIDVPTTDLFTTIEKANIKAASNSAYYAASALSNSQSSTNVLNALKEFTSVETGYSFTNYWNDRSFVAQSNFLRGESFYGISRFEFSDSFKEMYLDTYGNELLTTFAIFRGDIYNGNITYGSSPTNLVGTYESVLSSTLGNLSYGTWIYRVSAVTITGETPVSNLVPINIPPSSGSYNKVKLSWDSVTGALYYNIYRLGMSGVNYLEYKISTDGVVITNSYEDLGNNTGTSVNRGILFTGKKIETATRLSLYIPPVEGDFNLFEGGSDINSSYLNDTTIQNELIFQIYGIKSDLTIGGPHTITVPRGTARSTKYNIGSINDLYIGIYDITVNPGTDLNVENGKIVWSPYDLVVIQNI